MTTIEHMNQMRIHQENIINLQKELDAATDFAEKKKLLDEMIAEADEMGILDSMNEKRLLKELINITNKLIERLKP